MTQLSPVKIGVVWERLNGLMDQVAETCVRTSFSSVVRENYDFAIGLLDARGRQIAQSRRSVPSFIGTMSRTLTAMLDKYPVQTLRDGDVLITNDGWLGTGHLNDITMIKPIFRDGRHLGFVGSIFHTVDIGGAPSPAAKDCFEEGLNIPVAKILLEGEEHDLLVDILTANLREPEETLGDIRSQFSAYHACRDRLFRLLDEEELDDLEAFSDDVLDRSEASLRRAISAIPDGTYTDMLTADGFDHPLDIHCKVTISGSDITVDFAGTAEQIEFPVNSPMTFTTAYSCYAIKCALDPGTPINDGAFRPITVTAPEGTLVNPRRPAPVWGRHLSGHYMPPAIYGALSQIAPDKIIADCGSPLWNVYFKGRREGEDRNFVKMFFMNGGHGARPTQDGPGCLSFPSNVSNQAIEQFENQTPLLIEEKALIPDTGGIGQFRGGNAQRLTFLNIGEAPVTVTIRHERVDNPPRGLLGGGNGSGGLDLVNGKRIAAKSQTRLAKGDRVTFQTPGGGGMGAPDKRDAATIRADIDSGLVTAGRAKQDYGYTS
ncbi:hydantoinase B/oxoprolinase family protein [Puniceibacterium sp. IMCC21224]|uniref:hydantoinase B/oxoprolinase family protein n=1 Tax=Puniceibacterium sp. IMCC21224 TaxID=1618204 RepID=UPI00064DEAA9|nr:hydantoinase B/oxoprolinase family protein [Puniceibacterium sp. IMCC21224]KMK64873.1 N-methylhydantoinase B/acetone carboxylase, alpha subunit [Puniceibacterium sp. IMCC21224]